MPSGAYAPTTIALNLLALKHASSSLKSRGGSIHLAAEELDGGEPRRRRLPAPEREVVPRCGRVVERTNANFSLQHASTPLGT